MAQTGKQFHEGPEPSAFPRPLGRISSQKQHDFELFFFQSILQTRPDYVDVLRTLGNLLTLKGRLAEGLMIDRRLVRLRPNDSLAHYHLACRYALLKRREQSLKTLRRAMELGFRDFRYINEDRDLDTIRQDPRFRALLYEYENR